MKIDPKEMQQLAAGPAPRMDMYGGIHKALRALMADTLLAVGRMDADDDLDLAQATERLLQLLDVCASHLKHENEFVHAPIEARAPGASARIAHEHEQHEAHIAALGEAVASLRACPPGQRAAAAQSLYGELALFVADNFHHMHVEETAHNAVLWARYTDAENYYYVTLRSSNSIHLRKIVNGSFQTLVSTNLPVQLNRTYRVRLEAISKIHSGLKRRLSPFSRTVFSIRRSATHLKRRFAERQNPLFSSS